ncbi:MAG: alginate lyase family protein [Acidobacteriota bacterium]
MQSKFQIFLVSVSVTTLVLLASLLAAAPPGRQNQQGIWISPDELAELPTWGRAWARLKKGADRPAGPPDLSDQDQYNNVSVLAKALVYARTGEEKYRLEVIQHCLDAIGSERGGRTLALGRKLAAYVIAADLVHLPEAGDRPFRSWLGETLDEPLRDRTLRSTHEKRPNNWGTHAGASRAAVAAYLRDQEELERTARVFRGWLGETKAYNGFQFGNDLSWQCDPNNPVGINPRGCWKGAHLIDGVLPDDQRRGGEFRWPPPHENYVYEALQGAIVQAVILHRAGFDSFEWGDRALLRAYKWLYREAGFPVQGDDAWQLPLVDYFYGTSFWNHSPTACGKNMGWTDWTHSVPGGNSAR